ncbi:MAG TPA: hypothetical protein VIZ18_18360 [Ktedonobacteraceae bacterium]
MSTPCSQESDHLGSNPAILSTSYFPPLHYATSDPLAQEWDVRFPPPLTHSTRLMASRGKQVQSHILGKMCQKGNRKECGYFTSRNR